MEEIARSSQRAPAHVPGQWDGQLGPKLGTNWLPLIAPTLVRPVHRVESEDPFWKKGTIQYF
jgi:hypothetical protein